jgi:(p)ppGpp synthase/HD superfamily hydrolase
MTRLTPRFEAALADATRMHRNQVRKGTDIPYISHLLSVAGIALELGADEDQAIAALLHDAVEDCGGPPILAEIRERFGDRVAGIVAACSDAAPLPGEEKAPWQARKETYLAAMAHKDRDTLLVSLADKTHNARSIVDDLNTHGAVVWDRFNATREQSLWYYRELSDTYLRLLPGAGAERFAQIVTSLEQAGA